MIWPPVVGGSQVSCTDPAGLPRVTAGLAAAVGSSETIESLCSDGVESTAPTAVTVKAYRLPFCRPLKSQWVVLASSVTHGSGVATPSSSGMAFTRYLVIVPPPSGGGPPPPHPPPAPA